MASKSSVRGRMHEQPKVECEPTTYTTLTICIHVSSPERLVLLTDEVRNLGLGFQGAVRVSTPRTRTVRLRVHHRTHQGHTVASYLADQRFFIVLLEYVYVYK